jgi:hypothetical protein
VVPSLNWIVPLAVDGMTAATNVTGCPSVEGFGDEVSATFVAT